MTTVKIKPASPPSCAFGQLQFLDVFYYNGTMFIKVGAHTEHYNVVRLDNKSRETISDNIPVTPLVAEIIVHDPSRS